MQELDEHQVRKAALLLISTKAGEVTCCLARLVSAVQKSVVTEDAVPDYFSGDNRRDISQSVMLFDRPFTPFLGIVFSFFFFNGFFFILIFTDLRRVLRVVLFPLFGIGSRLHVKADRLVGRNYKSVHQFTASICKQVHVFPGIPRQTETGNPKSLPQKTTENHSRKNKSKKAHER